jgi:hypothetical protein
MSLPSTGSARSTWSELAPATNVRLTLPGQTVEIP